MKLRPDVADHVPRVLIVDDDRNSRQVLEVMLASEGLELLTAFSGEEALAIVARQPLDLILLDAMMPGLDGFQVTSSIKTNPATKNIPIIMVTALHDRDSRMRGLSAGAEDFLSKPVDRAELCARVRNLLRLKAHGDYHDQYSHLLEAMVAGCTADLVEQEKALAQHVEALHSSEEQTQYALGAARMGVWGLDFATQRITWSETMGPLFGLSAVQAPATANDFLAMIHHDDRQLVKDAGEQAKRDGAAYDVEFRAIWPDGSAHWMSTRACVLRDPGGNPERLLGVTTDIEDRKSLEAQFRQAQKMEAVGQLAGGVAHDFNNLLTVVLIYSNALLDTLDPDDPRRADVNEVISAGKRGAALTRQLLAFSRKQVLEPTVVDLNALVADTKPMLSRLIDGQVELVLVLASDAAAVRADRGQLEQVLMNLVLNARDAMPAGGRLAIETASVELDASFSPDEVIVRPGMYVMLAVSDTGTGMDAITRRRLFEPFFTTKDQGRGTGLGLATVNGIVKQNGGFIRVYSERDQGATFKIFLPRSDGDGDMQMPVAHAATATTGTECVLVAESETAVRCLTCGILEKSGYRVVDATDHLHAETLFEQNVDDVDLLVTDVILPQSSGPVLFERLSRRRPGLKVLYVSGFTEDTISHHGQLAPGVEFLQKPFTADALTRRVREVLDR